MLSPPLPTLRRDHYTRRTVLIVASVALVGYLFATNRVLLGLFVLVLFVLLYFALDRLHQNEAVGSYAHPDTERLPLTGSELEAFFDDRVLDTLILDAPLTPPVASHVLGVLTRGGEVHIVTTEVSEAHRALAEAGATLDLVPKEQLELPEGVVVYGDTIILSGPSFDPRSATSDGAFIDDYVGKGLRRLARRAVERTRRKAP